MVRRGEVVVIDFGTVIDHGPAKRRPAIVIQDDRFNASRLATTMVVALTSKLSRAEYPGNVFLPASATGLSRDAIAVATNVTTVDLDRIVESVGIPPPTLLADVDRGLRL